jgi:uncharacterized lipoprotein YmbA
MCIRSSSLQAALVSGLVAVVTVGCHVLPPSPPPASVHDLGPPPSAPAGAAAALPVPVTVSVQAPAWMGGGEVHYRFLFGDATQLQAYTRHRWVSPPSTLLEQYLKEGLLAAAPGASPAALPQSASSAPSPGGPAPASSPPFPAAGPQLRVELQRFEQVFAAPQRARAVVQLQAVLEGSEARLAGPHEVRVEVPAAATVDGAVAALAAAGRQAADRVLAWAAQQLAHPHLAAPR